MPLPKNLLHHPQCKKCLGMQNEGHETICVTPPKIISGWGKRFDIAWKDVRKAFRENLGNSAQIGLKAFIKDTLTEQKDEVLKIVEAMRWPVWESKGESGM